MTPIKILFASIPFDGHFNPLTSLAVHLKNGGHDVRWYTQDIYENKLSSLGIPHYPFKRAVQFNQFNLDEIFAERLQYKGQIARLNFDLQNVFINRAPEFFEDIQEINKSFSFDVLVADVMFTAIPLVAEKLNKPVVSIGVLPLVETSKDLAPAGLGLTPSSTLLGKLKQSFLRFLTDRVLFAKSHQLYREILRGYGINVTGNTIDFLVHKSTFFLQSGTPGFEYKRSDMGANIRFIGGLLPLRRASKGSEEMMTKLRNSDKVILVTQGTIEKDPEKLIVPVLEAFKESSYLVVATTGGSKTRALRERYPHSNIVIEDFIPFEEVLPYTSVFITNGGYGGVMLGIEHNVPLVVAGIHEGKNEINARVGYFKLGINLKTEKPSKEQISKSVEAIFGNPVYKKKNVRILGAEFRTYHPLQLTEKYVYEAVKLKKVTASRVLEFQE
jgi:MGT family glycosyltransferase